MQRGSDAISTDTLGHSSMPPGQSHAGRNESLAYKYAVSLHRPPTRACCHGARSGARTVGKGIGVLPNREPPVGRLSRGGPGDLLPCSCSPAFRGGCVAGPTYRSKWFFIVCVYLSCTACWPTCFLLHFPLVYYAGYVRQHAYGLSNQTFQKWLGDSLKGLAVAYFRRPAAVAALPADAVALAGGGSTPAVGVPP